MKWQYFKSKKLFRSTFEQVGGANLRLQLPLKEYNAPGNTHNIHLG